MAHKENGGHGSGVNTGYAFLGLFLNIAVVSVLLLVIKGEHLFLTYVVYRGLGLYGTPMSDIILLQASICITRGISFYLVMAVSFTVWGIVHLQKNKN